MPFLETALIAAAVLASAAYLLRGLFHRPKKNSKAPCGGGCACAAKSAEVRK